MDKSIRVGMPAIALTDHGNMYGIKELLDCCKKANGKLKAKAEEEGTEFIPFKPIVGIEAYCARRGRLMQDKDYKVTNAEGKAQVVDMSGWHLILLAKNKTGYLNLCKLTSQSFIDGFYRTARIDKELLQECHEGLICCSACLGGELPQKVMQGLHNQDFTEAEQTIEWFKALFGEDYYIEFPEAEDVKMVYLTDERFRTGEYVDFPLRDGKYLDMVHSLFDRDAVFLVGTGSKAILRNKNNANEAVIVDHSASNCPYLGMWHKPLTEAPYCCIEPFFGTPSLDGVVDDIAKKDDIVALSAGESFRLAFDIVIED